MKNYFYLSLALAIGMALGMMNALCIIAGLAEIILSSVLNIYYAVLFFIVGSYYSWKIFKKN